MQAKVSAGELVESAAFVLGVNTAWPGTRAFVTVLPFAEDDEIVLYDGILPRLSASITTAPIWASPATLTAG